MKNITILDGYTLNPGDLSWDKIESLGNLNIYQRTNSSEILARLKNTDIVLTNKVILDKDVLSSLTKLEYIGVLATGYNVVDVEEASRKGIPVTNVPAYGTHSVAQHAFGLILNLAGYLSTHFQSVAKGDWGKQEDFSYTVQTTHELKGKKLGIVGYGPISKQVIKIATAFEMDISVLTSHPDKSKHIHFCSKEELFKNSDFISIHTSLRPENEKLINRETLRLMRPGAFLVNTSRGGFINEKDLAEFLNSGRIAGAALDVLSKEPPDSGNPLLSAKNCWITPHIAWSTREARQRLMDIAFGNLKAFLDGNPVNVVN